MFEYMRTLIFIHKIDLTEVLISSIRKTSQSNVWIHGGIKLCYSLSTELRTEN